MRSIAQGVHVSFRTVEKAADWLTGSAGPVFVALCIFLVVGGIWTFFSSMFPELAQAPPELSDLFRTHSPAHIALGLATTIYNCLLETPAATANFFAWLFVCLFIIWSIGWHYYMACTEPPGSVLDGLGDSDRERRMGPGSSIWWARYRKRAAKASGPAVPQLAATTTLRPMDELRPTFEPSSPMRAPASLEDLRKSSNDSQTDGRSANPSGRKLSHLIASSRTSSHRSSSSQSSITFSSPRPAASPLPISVQEAELRVPEQAVVDSESDLDGDEEDDDLFPLARMCHKCPKVPLWKAMSVLPPELRQIERQLRSKGPSGGRMGSGTTKSLGDASPGNNDDDEGEAEIRAWLGDEEAEKLVPPPKPERSHHCRACKTCTLKYDHHCPWINGCVGLGNERYFVLFMVWLAVGCGVVTACGWRAVRRTFDYNEDWPHPYTPRVCVLLLYLLAVVMGFALAVMAGWQLIMVSRGETSVENNDNSHYRETAARRGQDFDNVYDLGRWKNLQLFFNVGPGSPYRWYTILLPRRIPPYSDGWHWAKKRGLGGRHAGVKSGEELTDEENDYDDQADVYRPDAGVTGEQPSPSLSQH